jgi:hypothetical protein
LQSLRSISASSGKFDESNILRGTLRTKEQPEKRLSDVLVYYGLRDPLKPLDELDNYRAAVLVTDQNAATEYGGAVTRTITSRWIPFGAQQAAERIGNALLSRYRDPPRSMSFDLFRSPGAQPPELGAGYMLGWTENQNLDGTPALAPVQVTRIGLGPDRYQVEAQELLFTQFDAPSLQDRVIVVSSNINGVILKALHDLIYPAITPADVSAGVTVTFIVNSGVVVGANETWLAAIYNADWPGGFTPELHIYGTVAGRGGRGGGNNGTAWTAGQSGGPALVTESPIALFFGPDAALWGGGGGGGPVVNVLPERTAYGGGGGAGWLPGDGGVASSVAGGPFAHGQAGSLDSPGSGTAGNRGGFPGVAGVPGHFKVNETFFSTPAGAPGAAIDGVSNVTFINSGDVRGPQIN